MFSKNFPALPRFWFLALTILLGLGLALAMPVMAQAQRIDHLSAPSATTATTYHVAKSGDGTDGLSWTTAFTNLQAALALAVSGDEIWVATGVYTPGISASGSFTLTAGIQLYGGFDGTETLHSQRNYSANLTILSGDIGGDDFTDVDGLVTDTANISGTNSYHVVWVDGISNPITETTVLDGFIITAGQAEGVFPDDCGGGLYCDGEGSGSECSPNLINLSFYGNAANEDGGGLFNSGLSSGISNPSLVNVLFFGNWSGDDGAGMYNFGEAGESSPSLINVIFENNVAADDAGGMYNRGNYGGFSLPTLTNVNFSGNSALDSGGALYNYGANGGDSSPFLTNVSFSSNSALDSGGAMVNYGDGGTSNPSLLNVSFAGNQAANEGGAMRNIVDNGGTSSPSLVNVIFSGNAANNGGALFSYGDGGTSSPSLINVTFSGNAATGVGGAMISDSGFGICRPRLNNVILWENTAGVSGDQLFNYDAQLIITNTLIQDGIHGAGVANIGSASVTDGGGNITFDPLFILAVDPASAPITDGNLQLQHDSPAIDAGDNVTCPSTDIRGVSRPQGTVCDIGAYESKYLTLTSTLDGDDSGTVFSDPPGIDCGTDCGESFAEGTVITLTATADSNSTFMGWSGDCSGLGDCGITMDVTKSVTATFTRKEMDYFIFLPIISKP